MRRPETTYSAVRADSDGVVRIDPKRHALIVNADGRLEVVDKENAIGVYLHRDVTCPTCGSGKPAQRYETHWAQATKTTGPAAQGLFVLVEVPQ